VKDHIHAKEEAKIQAQIVEKDALLKVSDQKASVAEAKASVSDTARVGAEKNYTVALNRVNLLEKQLAANSTKIAANAPQDAQALPADLTPAEAVELLPAEHEARVDCGEALANADNEIGSLKTANGALHDSEAILVDKTVLQEKQNEVVTKDRDTQVERKKLWRDTAIVSILINVAKIAKWFL